MVRVGTDIPEGSLTFPWGHEKGWQPLTPVEIYSEMKDARHGRTQ